MSINTSYDNYSSQAFETNSVTTPNGSIDQHSFEIQCRVLKLFAELNQLYKDHADSATIRRKADELMKLIKDPSVSAAFGGYANPMYCNIVSGYAAIENAIEYNRPEAFLYWYNDKTMGPLPVIVDLMKNPAVREMFANFPPDGSMTQEQKDAFADFILLLTEAMATGDKSLDEFFKGNSQVIAMLLFAHYYENNGHNKLEAAKSLQKLLEKMPASDSPYYAQFREYVKQYSVNPPTNIDDPEQRANWYQMVKKAIVDWIK